MSWSKSVFGTKGELVGASGLIETTPPSPPDLDEHMAKQHAVAKIAAEALIDTVPGPKLAITMSGHANGMGEQAKPGWSNDFINVTVSQVTP